MNDEQQLERRLIGLGKTAPRITPDHVDACIVGRTFHRVPNTLATHCVLALYNGHVIHHTNPGPVSADNFDPAVGEDIAFRGARDQIWALEGYLLRDRLHRAAGGDPFPLGVANMGYLHGSLEVDAEAAVHLAVANGYGWDEASQQWLRGDDQPAPTEGEEMAWQNGALRVLGAMDPYQAAILAESIGIREAYIARFGEPGSDISDHGADALGYAVIGADFGGEVAKSVEAADAYVAAASETPPNDSNPEVEQIDGRADIVDGAEVAVPGEAYVVGQLLPEGYTVADDGIVRRLYTEADAQAQLATSEPQGHQSPDTPSETRG